MQDEFLFLYGPPGSGKSTIGRALARRLWLPFYDLDDLIEASVGRTIPEIFTGDGEAGFRELERQALSDLLQETPGLVALGGGALTMEDTRKLAESAGPVLCLTADIETLLKRLQKSSASVKRPLLAGDMESRLNSLLARRERHYAGFAKHLDTSGLEAEAAARLAQIALGRFRVQGMNQPYDVIIQHGGLSSLGRRLRSRGLNGPLALVSDDNVAPLHAQTVIAGLESAGYCVSLLTIPAGEQHKTMQTIQQIWGGFLEAGLERSSTVIALGGGVVGDLTGFAAATYLRGVRWINLPTTLLAMADSSLGGKTGADLPQGKNLVGAFYPPSLVLADPQVLETLPEVELRSGMAEVIKHGIISDPSLFEKMELADIVRRAMAVKIEVIEADPYERGQRAALNLGHTIGHALETASEYRLRHGEAIAIGMVVEAALAERIGLAQPGLSGQIRSILLAAGLPVQIPDTIQRQAILAAAGVDKKKHAGKLRFALPKAIGEVVTGVEIPNLAELLEELNL